MPAIKIEMGNKWKVETAVAVKNIVMNVVKNELSLKSSERNIRVLRYDQDLFELQDDYEIFIELQLESGRSAGEALLFAEKAVPYRQIWR